MILPLLLTAYTAVAPAQAAVYRGRQGEMQVAIPRIEAVIEVDGLLEEDAWRVAARLTEFSQYAPVDGRPAENATEVLVWYSPTHIHFGVRARAAPGSVRASLANRDKLDAEDSVQILLSTFNDGRQAWMFAVNPLGVQADGALVEGVRRQGDAFGGLDTDRELPDLSPDFVFDSGGRLTPEGYDVELRIPFKSLRYQTAERQDWGLHVIRKVQSSGHEESWAPARRAAASFLSQSGTLTGLTDLRAGLVLDLTPIATAHVDGAPPGALPDGPSAGDGWRYSSGRPELGGNARWGVTPNLTLNGTVNPDFSQVESDAGQLVFDPRSAVFFPEKRPFFLDGIEQFETPNRLIYTRRIVAPLGAVKLTGKVSRHTIGLLSALDDRSTSRTGEDHPLFNILRLQRDLGGSSKSALVYTDKIDGSDYNRVAALDTRLAFGGIYSLELQGAYSRTRLAGATDEAPLWDGRFERNGRRFGFRYQFTGIDEDFRAASGFISRPRIVRAIADHRWTFLGKPGGWLESLSSDLVLDGMWQYRKFVGDGGIQDKKLHINNNAVLRGGWRAGASVLIESFGYDEDLYADYALERVGPAGREILPFTGTPALSNLDWVLTVDTPQFSRFSGTLFWLWGRDENFFEWSPADITYLTLTAEWRPTDQLRVSGQYQLQRFDRRSDGTTVGERRIPRLKIEYQLSRAVFFRLVGEYDAQRQDDLRDDSRTDLPIVIRDAATGEYHRALAFEDNRFRVDVLFSYQPTPGTVFFAGYGSSLVEPEGLRFNGLARTSDGFFVKLSYLFRL